MESQDGIGVRGPAAVQCERQSGEDHADREDQPVPPEGLRQNGPGPEDKSEGKEQGIPFSRAAVAGKSGQKAADIQVTDEISRQRGKKRTSFHSSSFRYSRISPGWQSRTRQISSRVEKRMALAF